MIQDTNFGVSLYCTAVLYQLALVECWGLHPNPHIPEDILQPARHKGGANLSVLVEARQISYKQQLQAATRFQDLTEHPSDVDLYAAVPSIQRIACLATSYHLLDLVMLFGL